MQRLSTCLWSNNQAEETVNVTVDEPFLPFTGGEVTLILIVALIAGALGMALYRLGRPTS